MQQDRLNKFINEGIPGRASSLSYKYRVICRFSGKNFEDREKAPTIAGATVAPRGVADGVTFLQSRSRKVNSVINLAGLIEFNSLPEVEKNTLPGEIDECRWHYWQNDISEYRILVTVA